MQIKKQTGKGLGIGILVTLICYVLVLWLAALLCVKRVLPVSSINGILAAAAMTAAFLGTMVAVRQAKMKKVFAALIDLGAFWLILLLAGTLIYDGVHFKGAMAMAAIGSLTGMLLALLLCGRKKRKGKRRKK